MKFFLIGLLFFYTHQSIADEPQITENQHQTSQELRKNQSMMATAQVAGIGPLSAYTTGVNFGFYIDPNSILDIAYHHNLFFANVGTLGSDYTIKFEMFGTHYKHFVKNSFYVKPGLEYRKLSYNYTTYFPDQKLEESTQFTGSTLTANFAIGNQWQWDHFTLGCDWVGIGIPIATTISSEYSAGTYSHNLQRLSDDKQRYIKDIVLYFGQFYIGASF